MSTYYKAVSLYWPALIAVVCYPYVESLVYSPPPLSFGTSIGRPSPIRFRFLASLDFALPPPPVVLRDRDTDPEGSLTTPGGNQPVFLSIELFKVLVFEKKRRAFLPY